MRTAGGLARPAVVDSAVPAKALERLGATSDNTQRTGRPGSRVIEGIAIVAGTPKVVDHGCASSRVYWVICDVQAVAAPSVWRTAIDDRQITLQADVSCTIAIEVWST